MADETDLEKEVNSIWKRYSKIAVILAAFSGGSITATLTFATSWVEMNSRPFDVVNAADLTPELLPLINENDDAITEIQDALCEADNDYPFCED